MAVLLAALPLYVFMRTFLEKRPALLGLTVYLFSHHLLGNTKVGYTYSQLLVPIAAGLALMALAIRRGSMKPRRKGGDRVTATCFIAQAPPSLPDAVDVTSDVVLIVGPSGPGTK